MKRTSRPSESSFSLKIAVNMSVSISYTTCPSSNVNVSTTIPSITSSAIGDSGLMPVISGGEPCSISPSFPLGRNTSFSSGISSSAGSSSGSSSGAGVNSLVAGLMNRIILPSESALSTSASCRSSVDISYITFPSSNVNVSATIPSTTSSTIGDSGLMATSSGGIPSILMPTLPEGNITSISSGISISGVVSSPAIAASVNPIIAGLTKRIIRPSESALSMSASLRLSLDSSCITCPSSKVNVSTTMPSIRPSSISGDSGLMATTSGGSPLKLIPNFPTGNSNSNSSGISCVSSAAPNMSSGGVNSIVVGLMNRTLRSSDSALSASRP
mmetsp:Transcript_6297/g.10003  ORF Transcript_6297/g.10003 Transcript_6297/m.10003 type:complete len:329 (-) Transcript_6297:1030-2016(-)